MKGTILDFLNLAAENPALTKDLVDLATKHDFVFSAELSDEELDAVSGGCDGAASAEGMAELKALADEAMKAAAAAEAEQDAAQLAATQAHIKSLSAQIMAMSKLWSAGFDSTLKILK